MLKREQEIQNDPHFDDEYWYNKYLEEKQYAESLKQESVQQDVHENVQNHINLKKD
jgi:hypothetical protein